MIKTELITVDNRQLRRTWSDVGFMIERDGAVYSEAVDPVEFDLVYTETDTPVESGSEDEIDPNEAVSAIKILLGMEE